LYCAWRHNLSLRYVDQVIKHLQELPGGQLLQNLEPVLIQDTQCLPEYSLIRKLSQEEGFSSLCLWPLVYEGTALAIIGLYHNLTHSWSEADQQSLSALSRQAAVALQNAHLFDETRRRAFQQEALNEIIAAVVTAPDLEHLLETVIDLTLRAVRVEKGAIWVSGKSALRGFPPDIDAASAQIAQSPNKTMPAKQIVDDWLKIEPGDPQAAWVEHMAKHGIQASVYVPILAGITRIGGLSLASETSREWLPEEVDLVEAVGRQLGSAVERLELLAKTQEQARQMQQIIDTVPEGVLLLDAEYKVVLANPAAQEYLSILTDRTQPDQPVLCLASYPIEQLLQTNPKETRRELKTSSAQNRIFEVAVRHLEVQAYPTGWVLVLQDVTQERQDQARIQMQERLATVGQLAAGIAHDFNNIMAAVVVYTDLLSMEPNLKSSSRKQLMIIQEQVQRAVSLIRQILDFSRRAVMEQSVVDLLPFLKELDKLLARVLPENIQIEFTYQPGSYPVKVDPARLQQALMNLALNARDAMPEGGSLYLSLDRFQLAPEDLSPSRYVSPGDWIRLVVRDTGTGIAPDVLPHIFDPFFTTKPVGRGTGLGLAQVYGIIKQHGGSIEARSKDGEGAAFEIYLPALQAQMEEARTIQPTPPKAGSGEAMLLVEDDPVAREALKSLLENQNYRVFSAEDGAEALQIFDQVVDQIALVISDVVMPNMGGVKLYRTLQERQPQIKFLFITGHPMDFENQILLEAGRVEWLQKPFTVPELSSALKSMLAQAS
jgi:signal transduction histidine kinase/ActR/RegA family two-component response regulator